MTHPRVSVIIPTFNRAEVLGHAIDSVRRQTYLDFELIVVDDGSIDSTELLVLGINDSRIVYLRQENQGQSVARNTGIEKARGEYIAFLDSDNTWVKTKLADQVILMDADPSISVLHGNSVVVSEAQSERPLGQRKKPSGMIANELILRNFVSFNTAIVRIVPGQERRKFDPLMRAGEDYDFWLRLSLEGRFVYVDKDWAKYSVEGDRVSNDHERVFGNNLTSLKRLFENNPGRFSRRARLRAVSRVHHSRGRARVSNGQFRRGAHDYYRAILHDPAYVWAWKSLVKLLLLKR